jgi:hypothetical protein
MEVVLKWVITKGKEACQDHDFEQQSMWNF